MLFLISIILFIASSYLLFSGPSTFVLYRFNKFAFRVMLSFFWINFFKSLFVIISNFCFWISEILSLISFNLSNVSSISLFIYSVCLSKLFASIEEIRYSLLTTYILSMKVSSSISISNLSLFFLISFCFSFWFIYIA